MKKRCLKILIVFLVIVFTGSYVSAHCEIPCGIYDDEMRINIIAEHINTIEKSMQQIRKLTSITGIDYNQLSRWIMNKEHHADELQEVVTQYFMTQRIKPDTKHYSQKLILLHKILVSAMKCKQTTDFTHIKDLRFLLEEFRSLYFGGKP
ncbi:MAG: superoxide dismutase [Ni] [Thermodesulfobacteriota bacterium]|nr:superoxide dismutase [Ni] [Thermodesulfobacteriota bacterium]